MFVQTPKSIQALFPSLIWRKETKNKEVWLTFDDGPSPEITPWVLAVLKQENIKATFFLVGEKIEKYPKLVSAIVNEGHTIANHSYSHKNGWICSKKKYIADVNKCQELMPKNNLFRPPYGKITKAQISALKVKYKIIMWDILSCDFNKNISSEKIKSNVLNNVENGSIIVFHDNKKSGKILKENLEEILNGLVKKGFSFSVTW